MRIAIVSLLVLLSTQAMADPICEVNDRGGSYSEVRGLQEGIIRSYIAAGTVVDVIILDYDLNGRPYALVSEPGELDVTIGWVDRRHITCR